MRYLAIIAASAAFLFTNGCLEGEIKQTLYLETDGSVTLTLVIRVDDPDRDADELMRALAEDIADLEAEIYKIGAEYVTSQIIRKQAPFTYVSQATFADATTILAVLFEDWPGLQWEETWQGDRRELRFFIAPETTLPTEVTPLEVVAVSGSVGRDGQKAKTVNLVEPHDWQGMRFSW